MITRKDITAREAQCLRGNFPLLLGQIDNLGYETYQELRQMRDDMQGAGFIIWTGSSGWEITARGKAAIAKVFPE